MNAFYVPILRGKKAECDALARLDPAVKSRLLPLIDLPRLPLDAPSQEAAQPPEGHFGPRLQRLLEAWGPGHDLLLDSPGTPIACRTADGRSYLSWMFERCKDLNLSAIPVTDLGRPDEFQDVIRGIHKAERCGAALRLGSQDVELSPQDLESNISELLLAAGLSRADTFLILDLGHIRESDVGGLIHSVRKILAGLPRIQDYRSVVLAASSMPTSFSKIMKADSMQSISRTELSLWQNVLRSRPRCRPIFGDHGVVSSDWVEPSNPVRTSPTIRYTTEDSWLVLRGQPFHKHPKKYGQYRDLARMLARRQEYRGRTFSWGDDYVTRCAEGTEGTGNLITWIAVGTNHHVTFTARQAQRLLAAAA